MILHHQSLMTNHAASPLSLLTNHVSPLTAALAAQVCFQDLVLAFSPGASRLEFRISYSSSKAVVSRKDWLNSGYNDYGDLDNDGNSLTASSGEEDAQTAENFK